MPSKSPYLIGIKEIYESNNKIDNLDYLHKSKKEFSPLSGSEPKYNPKKWNDNDNIRSNHNCYAYVLNHPAILLIILHLMKMTTNAKYSINACVKTYLLFI